MEFNLKNLKEKAFWIADWEDNEAYNEQMVIALKDLEGLEKELREKYVKLCETRIGNIGDDNQCFLIEEIFDAEADEILGELP